MGNGRSGDRDLRIEHFDDPDHADRRGGRASGSRGGNALLQPGSPHAAGRGHPRRKDFGRDDRDHLRAREEARQDADRRQRSPGFPRQPHSCAVSFGSGPAGPGGLPHRRRRPLDDRFRDAGGAARAPGRSRVGRRGQGGRSPAGRVSGANQAGRRRGAGRGRTARAEKRFGLLRVLRGKARGAVARRIRRVAGGAEGVISVPAGPDGIAPRSADGQRGGLLPGGRGRRRTVKARSRDDPGHGISAVPRRAPALGGLARLAARTVASRGAHGALRTAAHSIRRLADARGTFYAAGGAGGEAAF